MNVRLTDSQLAWIEAEATKTNKGKSQIVRELIASSMDEEVTTISTLARMCNVPYNDVVELVNELQSIKGKNLE